MKKIMSVVLGTSVLIGSLILSAPSAQAGDLCAYTLPSNPPGCVVEVEQAALDIAKNHGVDVEALADSGYETLNGLIGSVISAMPDEWPEQIDDARNEADELGVDEAVDGIGPVGPVQSASWSCTASIKAGLECAAALLTILWILAH